MAENIEVLDQESSISEIDTKGMLQLVEKLPDMMNEGWASAAEVKLPELTGIDNVVIAGMGGSAISGDIASIVLKASATVPISVNRSYLCPSYISNRTLFIALSYSGNTEETISSFKEALKKGAKIISISSGGELQLLSTKNKIPLVTVPKGLPPRAALGYLLSSLLSVLDRTGIGSNIPDDFHASVEMMKTLLKKWKPSVQLRENAVKQAAVKIAGKIPVIMASVDTTAAAALRWKTQLNENSKATALLAVFPELNHNDMVNFAHPSNKNGYTFVALRDAGDTEKMKKRIEITKSLISGSVGGIFEIWSEGEGLLERTMSLILYGDLLSVYLAILKKVDPTPVDIIERLKKELTR
jgi:glucose/mannose-6-phosphate isomerase